MDVKIIETMAERLMAVVQEKDPDEAHPKTKIAEICDISQSAVYQWYQGGTKDPKAVHVGTVCRYYNADIQWVILGGKKSPEVKGTHKEDPPLKNTVIDRLCEGMHESGIVDIKSSLMQTANDVFNVSFETITAWLNKQKEPSFEEIARLCEFYGVAQRYVAIGKGPKLALDYIRAVDNKKLPGSHEVINLQDVALLGNV